MTQDFEWDNIPEEMTVEPLHEKYTLKALDILKEAIANGNDRASEAKIGFAYNRKGWMQVEEIAPANGAHNWYNSQDDVVVQVTIRMPRPDANSKFAKLADALTKDAEDARIAVAEAEIAEIEAAEAALAERKAKAQENRDKLKK